MPETRTATIEQVRQLTPDVRELVLRTDGHEPPVKFVPGQWLSLHLPIGDHPPLIRAYSLAAAPQLDGRLTLCFDRVDSGLGTGYLWGLTAGDTLTWAGPVGNFALPQGNGGLLLAARYTGIVPFHAMIEQLWEAQTTAPRQVTLIYGAPSEAERVYGDEFAALAEQIRGFEYIPVPEGEEESALEFVSAVLNPDTALVCGVRDFTAPMRAAVMERFGLERRAVKVENYTGPTR